MFRGWIIYIFRLQLIIIYALYLQNVDDRMLFLRVEQRLEFCIFVYIYMCELNVIVAKF